MIFLTRITIEEANEHVARWHRHNDPVFPCQARFAWGMLEVLPGVKVRGRTYQEPLGVGIVGNPCGRPADKTILELRRVAFKPGEKFGRIRRHYQEPDKDLSMRKIPWILNSSPYLENCGVVLPHQIPSMFVKVGTILTKHLCPYATRMWTYLREEENGAYLEKAGYEVDHYLFRRGVAKRRYEIVL